MTPWLGSLLLTLVLVCGVAACGKYGPPERIGASADAAAHDDGGDAEAECEDEEKQP